MHHQDPRPRSKCLLGFHEQLPLITWSGHNHYDHFDINTLGLTQRTITAFIMASYVEHIPFKEVIELAWYESQVRHEIEVTALPVVHFSL